MAMGIAFAVSAVAAVYPSCALAKDMQGDILI